ncbi:MAG: methylmalonyl-CoA mutase family protein [Bacteroidales bacterium]|jgi:methylmalonyl-CoA mutase|nr:methylmalonyl-CoA mutase family protein [Bacteroidales bacterium]
MNDKLFTQFPPISTQEWEDLILKDLKGADYEKKLVWKTNENISVQPYYREEDLESAFQLSKNGTFPYRKMNDSNWKVRQDFFVNDDLSNINEQIHTAINNGVTSIGLNITDLESLDKEYLYKLLRGVCPEMTEINFICNDNVLKLLGLIKDFFTDEKLIAERIYINIEFDPFEKFITEGKSSLEGIETLRLLILNSGFAPNMRVGVINAGLFANCGASIVEEIAFGISEFADLLDYLTEAGLTIDEIAKRLKFKTSIGSNYFMEIAKIRAIRFIWTKIVEAYEPTNIDNCNIYLHAETSSWNKTLYDPYVNMLRTTTESMSSILGGIDSLNILPFNFITMQNDDFAFRIARNQQLLLKEESNFDKVADPAAGSYYIENLTSQIINRTWEQFLMIIEKHGFINCFKNNFIQDIISESSTKRDNAIATRKENFVGVNQFPNITETIDFELKDNEETPEIPSCCAGEESDSFKTLQTYRGPEAFERLRLKTELFTKETGHRPTVFLFTYGNLAMRIARAGFASNFFGCAGYEIINNNGFTSVEVGVAAAKASNADIVVICSADEEYEVIAPEIYNGLKDDAIIVIAGNPKDSMDKLTSIGIKHFIHVKTNLLESLEYFQDIILNY